MALPASLATAREETMTVSENTRTTFRRPISPTERLYLAGGPLTAPFAIQMIVEGFGDISLRSLADAVAVASAHSPGSRLVRSGNQWVDSGATPNVERLESAALDFAALDEHPLLRRPFGGIPGATTEVLVLPGTPTQVVFRAFHGVMDAKGLHLWASDVFRVLRGEEPSGAPETTSDQTLVDRIGAPGKATRLTPTKRSPLGRGKLTSDSPRFLTRHRSIARVSGAAVPKIAEILSAFAAQPLRLMVPVDLRRHDPAIRSTANLALPLFLDVEPGRSWSEINAQMLVGLVDRRELNEMDNGGLAKLPAPVVRTVLRTANRLGARSGRNTVSAIVSHAGLVDPADFSTPDFSADCVRALPVDTGLVPLSFVVVDNPDSTEIAVSARGGRGIAERLDALLDVIAAKLGSDPSQPDLGTDTVIGLFRAKAAEAPSALAVASPDGDLTYGELDRRAGAVAAELQRRGVGRGDLVGILADRTPASIAGQLGILRAGAAFLPLDAKHPRERRDATLADAGVRVCLAERGHADDIDPQLDIVVLEAINGQDEPTPVDVRPEDIVYVTYTSGSTGKPKGVEVTHGGVASLIGTATEWFDLGPDTRYAHYHTPAADMACAAMLFPLLTGGAVTLIPGEVNHVSLQSMLCESGANTFLLTPSLLDTIVRLGIEIPTPRTVIIGGEKLTTPLATRARAFFGPDVRLLNAYGPTEMSIICTAHVIDALPDPTDTVPIGTTPACTPVHVLDDRLRPVPAGEIGELYFSGPQVARGYLGRPELTASRFVRLPDGRRAYRTGDLGRIRPDGTIDFAGRVDEQVKIRGNRVEPGEVQSVVEKFPGVHRAAVVARQRDETTILVAYLIAEPDLDIAALRGWLAEHLPVYMIPAAVHLVDEMPITSNGKLDVSRLPGADAVAVDTRKPARREVARDEPFEQIAAIWSSVLRVDVANLHDGSDFFALGGDSLASVEMFAQVSKSVVGRAGEAAFVAQLEGLIHQLTLVRVHAAAISARDGVPT